MRTDEMDPDNLQIGDPVSASPVGAGKITGITARGYPQVNHVAVTWLERPDGARFDPHDKAGGSRAGAPHTPQPADAEGVGPTT